ncbi:MAG TPA: YggS family pyridoxal phosphate-dependent enzyme [Gemmatimonadota bacterium]|nr:YggS family pyridoxal phosphate-dependent enzyme [Gemmatimonadota bacterium]
MLHDGVTEGLRRVEDRIADVCAGCGRDPSEIRIVAITKGHPASTLIAALEAGLRQIGENRVGEAVEKFSAAAAPLERHGAERHMVGHLQRNKARLAVHAFDWIQSVDSLRLAEELSRRVAGRPERMPVLIEVNAGAEEQKHGFAPEQAIEEAGRIAELPGLAVRGLMTMAPFTSDERVVRATFRRARTLFERLAVAGGGEGPDTLSMGMSGDFDVAIEEGSTMLRLGTVLFGPREKG